MCVKFFNYSIRSIFRLWDGVVCVVCAGLFCYTTIIVARAELFCSESLVWDYLVRRFKVLLIGVEFVCCTSLPLVFSTFSFSWGRCFNVYSIIIQLCYVSWLTSMLRNVLSKKFVPISHSINARSMYNYINNK